MHIAVKLPVLTSVRAVSRPSLCPHSPKRFFFHGTFTKSGLRLKRSSSNSKHFQRITVSSENKACLSKGFDEGEDEVNGGGDIWGDSEFVEVIGIGSRKDAVLDFCLGSPFKSSSMRFWNILMKDSMEVQLQQRFLGRDLTPKIVEAPLSVQSFTKAIILVCG